jgi:hypothetical protein
MIVFGPQDTVFHCTILDMSFSGVRLRVDREDPIANSFILILEDRGIEADCEIVWRRGLELYARASLLRRRTKF